MDARQRDREVLRPLAARQAEIAQLPIHRQTARRWQALNDLRPERAMVWINEIPWHEMDHQGELALQCTDPVLREAEQTLRRTLYQWDHLPADMIVEPCFYSSKVVCDTGFGLSEEVDIAVTDATSDILSRRFHELIRDEADLERIQMPRVTCDAEATARRTAELNWGFGDLLPVVERGQPGFWFAPWDQLIRWWGVERAMLDLHLRPTLVHAAMDRLVTGYLARLDQYVAQGLLAPNANNTRIGSGGLGHVSGLPEEGVGPNPTQDLWGCATAQIFSDVSPRMHAEFALRYERRWLERWGLNYYGCCEPLDLKVALLKREVPRLRKISMSPWVSLERAAAAVGHDLVFSRKPNPAIFAEDGWNPARARAELEEVFDRAGGCVIELIMKDVSTVRYQPQRLWEWARVAMEVVEERG